MTLAQLKSRLTIKQVLQHYGLAPDRNSMLCCPFHEDKHPSMKIYLETNSVYCFSGNCPTHGHSLDVVDVVMWKEGWEQLGKEGKSKAIALAKSWIGEENPAKAKETPKTYKQMPTENRVELLTQAWSYFQQNVSAEAEQYLKSRSLA